MKRIRRKNQAPSLNIPLKSAIIGIEAGREVKAMSTMPVSIPQVWNHLSAANQKHALTYMEFLYHQQQESEKRPMPLPYNILKGKMVIPEGFDDPMPEFEEYR